MYEQDRVLTRLQQHVRRDFRIVVCVLEGSFGRRTADAYSDLDVALGYADDASRAAAWAERARFATEVLPYVAARSADGGVPFLHRAVYANGARVDFRYALADELRPGPDVRALKEPAGWQSQTSTPALPPAPPTLSAAALRDIDDSFWIFLLDVERHLQRGDSETPFPLFVALLHDVIQPLFAVLPAGHPLRLRLLQLQYKDDARHNRKQLRALLDTYRETRAAVLAAQRLDLADDPTFERQVERLFGR